MSGLTHRLWHAAHPAPGCPDCAVDVALDRRILAATGRESAQAVPYPDAGRYLTRLRSRLEEASPRPPVTVIAPRLAWAGAAAGLLLTAGLYIAQSRHAPVSALPAPQSTSDEALEGLAGVPGADAAFVDVDLEVILADQDLARDLRS